MSSILSWTIMACTLKMKTMIDLMILKTDFVQTTNKQVNVTQQNNSSKQFAEAGCICNAYTKVLKQSDSKHG